MDAYLAVFSAILPVFLIVGTGILFSCRGWLGEDLEVGMMKVVLNLLLPCFILTLVPGNPALIHLASAAQAIGVGFIGIVVGIGVGWGLGILGGLKRGEGHRTFAIASGIQNYSFLALPIVVSLFPQNSGPAGLIFVHGIGVELAMWTLGLAVMSGKMDLRLILNGPFIAVTAALLLNYTEAYRFIPEVANTTMEMLGRCAVPMAVLMIGATIGRFLNREIASGLIKVGTWAVIVRLLLMGTLILTAAKWLPISDDLRRLLVVQAAMPSAIFPIVLARLFGGTPKIAIQVVIGTSLVGLFTAPMVIAWGLRWIGN